MEDLLTNNPFPDYKFPEEDPVIFSRDWFSKCIMTQRIRKNLEPAVRKYFDECEKKAFRFGNLFTAEKFKNIELRKKNRELFQEIIRHKKTITEFSETKTEKEFVKLQKMYKELSDKFSKYPIMVENQSKTILNLQKKIQEQKQQINVLNNELSMFKA